MKRDLDACVPMKCAVCQSCCRARDASGQLLMRCVYGGPFAGYAKAGPDERPPVPLPCSDGTCPI